MIAMSYARTSTVSVARQTQACNLANRNARVKVKAFPLPRL
jgi:hypothetical protein